MEIIKGSAVRYYREYNSQSMQDPTMNHVVNVRAVVSKIVDRLVCKADVEWHDEFTCKITLPEGWQWREAKPA